MALLMIDGFEGYNDSNSVLRQGNLSCKWISCGALGLYSTPVRTTQVTAANSRCAGHNPTSGGMYLGLRTPASTELIVGCGFYTTANTNGITSILNIGGLGYASQGITLGWNPGTGNVTVYVPGASGEWNTAIATSSITMGSNTWHYVEMRVKLGTTTGEIEVRINGSVGINVTNVNTASGSLSSYQTVTIMPYNPGSGTWWYIDDLYVLNTTGTTNNTFLGPVSVYTLMPTGPGTTTQMTPVGAASNWQAVNDVTDNTTTYVETSTTGHKDYYTFQSLPGSVTQVLGVALKARSTIPGSGNRRVRLNIRNGLAEIAGALKNLTLGTWLQEHVVADTAPDGSAWTPALVNTTEGGTEAG